MNDRSSKAAAAASAPKLVAFPWSGIAYTECLYAEAIKIGVNVVAGIWAGRWLNAEVRRGDVIHIHWPSFLYFDASSKRKTFLNLARFALFFAVLKKRGVRIAWTAHNLYPHGVDKREWSHRIARYIISRRADRVFAHGDIAARMVAEEFGIPKERVETIQHGHWIDFHPNTASREESRRKLNIEPGRFVYAFFGGCSPYKNLEFLIETFARLEDDSILLIAGNFLSPSYQQKIGQLIEKLPRERWRFVPAYIENEDVQHYLLAGDVMVLPHSDILTSGSAMLGLSFGRPVVAPDLGGLRDMVDSNCGLLYDAAHPDGLLNAMRSVRTQTFSTDSIIRHARKFGWTDAAQSLARLTSS